MVKKLMDIDSVPLTFGTIAKVIAALSVVVTVAGAYFNLQHRQEAFEDTQHIQNAALIEQIAEIKADVKDSKQVMQSMQLTLQRTNVILEQMEKKQ